MPKRDGLRTKLSTELKMDESTPGWQDAVMKRLEERAMARKKPLGREANYYRFKLITGKSLPGLLRMAAEKRGISLQGYMRRALAAFVAYDLGLDMTKVLEDGPATLAWGRTGGKVLDENGNVITQEDGKGYGQWVINDLRD